MEKTLKELCSICKGGCCKKTAVFVTSKEFVHLLKYKKDIEIQNTITGSNTPPGDLLQDKSGNCPFLDTSTGCTLPPRYKPFDCSLFPITFIYKNGKTIFYLNKTCTFFDQISEKQLETLKNLAKQIVSKLTEEEKKSFSLLIEKYPKSQLIRI